MFFNIFPIFGSKHRSLASRGEEFYRSIEEHVQKNEQALEGAREADREFRQQCREWEEMDRKAAERKAAERKAFEAANTHDIPPEALEEILRLSDQHSLAPEGAGSLAEWRMWAAISRAVPAVAQAPDAHWEFRQVSALHYQVVRTYEDT